MSGELRLVAHFDYTGGVPLPIGEILGTEQASPAADKLE